MGKRKKEDNTFLRKNSEEKQISVTIMISADGKEMGIVWTKILKKRILKKI